jgi:hypothetical protein
VTESVKALLDNLAEPLSVAERDELSDQLMALAARLRVEAPLRAGVMRDLDPAVEGEDQWMILIEFEP